MGILNRIINWFTGGNRSSGSNAPRRNYSAPTRVTNYGGGGSSYRSSSGYSGGGSSDFSARLAEQKRQQAEKRRKLLDAFKSEEHKAGQSATRTTPPDPKQTILNERAQKRRDLLQAYHAATNNRYNPSVGTPAQRAQARQRVKMGMYQEDPNVSKFETKAHPLATSAARGALSGVTFGGSELVAKYAPRNAASREAEQFYQQNKSKGAEFAGEMAGSLLGFGLTGEMSARGVKAAASKLAPRALEKTTAGATERLATSSLIRRAAEKEAVRRFGVEGATKEVIQQIARRRAEQAVAELGKDAAINVTTGLASDLSHAALDSQNAKDFAKNMAASAGMNLALGGATSLVPAFRAGRGAVGDAIEGVARNADDAVENVARNADEAVAESPVNISLNRRRRTDVIAPEVRPQTVDNAVSEAAVPEAIPQNRVVLGNGKKTYTFEVYDPDGAREIVTVKANKASEASNIAGEYGVSKGMNWSRNITNRRAAPPTAVENAVERNADEVANAAIPQAENVIEPPMSTIDEAAEIPPVREAPAKAEPPKADDFEYATIDDRMPVDGDLRQTEVNDTKAQLEERARKVASGEAEEPEITVNKASGESGELPKGVQQAREAHFNATEEEVVGGKPTNFSERYDAYKEYHQSQGTSERRKQSRAAASQINAMDSEAERELREKLARQGSLDYETISTPELYDQVSKEFRDDAEHWIGRIIDASEDADKVSLKEIPEMQARCQYLMAVLDPSADESAEAAYTAAFKLAKDISSKSGQSLNLRRNFVHLTEAGKIESTVDDLVKLLDSSIGFEKKHKLPRGKYDRINAIKGIIMDDPQIKAGIEKLVKAKSEDDVAEAYTELMLTLNKQNPKTGFDVIQEMRYLNMLGNPKTHIRNIFGSALFSPMRMISNTIRSGIESSISKKAGLEVTRHGGISLEAFKEARTKNPTTEAGKKAAEAFTKLRHDILGSAKYENVQYKGRAKTAAGKFLDTLSDLNSDLLSKEDDFFRQRAFKENYIKSYNKYLKNKVPITEKIERQIEEEAIRESQIATFNEYNSLAEFLNKIERKAYDAKATTGERFAGAAVNAVMPFTKVPANILKQSINYSPAGIARGYANIAKAAKTGDSQMLNTAIDQLASGLTGSGVMALGLLLGNGTDAFTTNAGKDDYAAKFKKAQGVQNYSVTFTDPDTGKATSITLDWLVPTSSVFFMGVELANQMKSGDFNALDFGGDWAQVTSRLIEPVMETSMLSGLYSTLESMRSSYGDDDKQSALALMGRETAQSYLNSLIPTVAGQVARTAYKTDKQVSGDTDWEYFKNSIKSKTGLAADNAVTRKLGIEPLGADTDAYGNVKGEKETTGDYAKSFLKNFISPANIQKVDLSELDRAKIKQYEDAVKAGADPKEMSYLFPKKQYKKQFSVADMDVKLSNQDLSTYNQAKTTGGEEGMRTILESIMFNRYDKDASGKKTILREGYTEEEKQQLIKQFEGKSLREVEQWLYDQPEFKNADEAEKRKAIDHIWNLTSQGKSQGARRVGEQAVIKAQGGDVDEYNFKNELSDKKREALQPYIDAGIITYGDAVDFARHAGKTYYTENDEGGTSQTYYNKAQMLEYLQGKGYTEEQAAALFNAFKAGNAKAYGSSSGRRGRRRRRGYRRRGYSRGGKSTTAKLVSEKVDTSAYKTKEFKSKQKTSAPKAITPKSAKATSKSAKALASALDDIKKTQAKVAPPKARR